VTHLRCVGGEVLVPARIELSGRWPSRLVGANDEVRRVRYAEIIDAYIALRAQDDLRRKRRSHVVQRVVHVLRREDISILYERMDGW
jgi:hypothetical protein